MRKRGNYQPKLRRSECMSKRPIWNVSIKLNGKITIYEFDGESAEYVTRRAKRSLEGEIIKVEMIEE